MSKDSEILEDAKEAFELAKDAENENRVQAMDDIRFARLPLSQWPDKVRKDRELDGRPCLEINKLEPVIRQVVNDARQNTPAIVVHPVDDNGDPATAQVLQGLIRNIERSSDAEVAYDTALDFAVTGGFGYFRINTRYAFDDTFDQDLVIERIADPFSVYGDPHSTAADSSDWNSAFVVDMLPRSVFKQRYKGAEEVDWSSSGYDGLSGSWRDGDKVMVAEYWVREETRRQIVLLSMPERGIDPATQAQAVAMLMRKPPENAPIIDLKVYEANKALFDAAGMKIVGRPRDVASHKVTQRLMTGCEVLETVDWAGKYIPIVPVYGDDLIIDGKRHLKGMVRTAKDAQRMFNYWRTTSTELVALAPKAPFIGRKGAFETDAAKWATANVQTHAYIEYDGSEPPQRQPFSGVPAGAIQEAMNAADDIRAITGLHEASLGQPSNETSGRAILARQREGDTSSFHLIDNLSRAMRHAGRILVDLIPQVYSAPRVVRILGKDDTTQRVQINAQFQDQEKGPDGQMRSIARIYDLTTGKYDVTVDAGPSFATQREEAASQMIELIRAYPAAAPIIGDLLAKNLDWPGADEIAERLQKMLPAALHDESPEADQAKQQIAALAKELKAANDRIQALSIQGANDSRELDIKAYEAETKRLAALNQKQTPLDPQAQAQLTAQLLMDALRTAVLPGAAHPEQGPGQPEEAEPGPDADDMPPAASEAAEEAGEGAPDAEPDMPPSAADAAEAA